MDLRQWWSTPAPQPIPPRTWRSLVLIALLGFALRVGWLVYAQPEPVSDYAKYLEIAGQILEHAQVGYPEPSAWRMPGFPLFLALLMSVSRSSLWLSFGNVLLSSSLVWLIFLLARRLHPGETRLPLAAALVWAVNPGFIFYASILGTEGLFTVLLLGGLLLVPQRQGPVAGRAALSGLALGAAVLTRGEGLVYLPVYLAVAALGGDIRRLFRIAIPLVAAFGIVIGYWYVRNYVLVGPGAGLATEGGLVFYTAHNEHAYAMPPELTADSTRFKGLSEVEVQKLAYRLGWENLRAHPLDIVRTTVLSTLAHYRPGSDPVGIPMWRPAIGPAGERPAQLMRPPRVFAWARILGYLALLALALASIPYLRSAPAPLWGVPLLIVLANWFCYGFVFFGHARYRHVAEVAMCLLAGLFLSQVAAPRPARPQRAG